MAGIRRDWGKFAFKVPTPKVAFAVGYLDGIFVSIQETQI